MDGTPYFCECHVIWYLAHFDIHDAFDGIVFIYFVAFCLKFDHKFLHISQNEILVFYVFNYIVLRFMTGLNGPWQLCRRWLPWATRNCIGTTVISLWVCLKGNLKMTKFLNNFILLAWCHYCGVIMSMIASQITGVSIVLIHLFRIPSKKAFVWGIHWWPVNSLHKGPVTRKMFPFDDVIMYRTS